PANGHRCPRGPSPTLRHAARRNPITSIVTGPARALKGRALRHGSPAPSPGRAVRLKIGIGSPGREREWNLVMSLRPRVSPALDVNSKNSPMRLCGLDRDVIRIGRDAASALPIEDQRVSRSHARILRRTDGFYVEDLGSHNLTYLDELPLPS